MNTNKLVQCFVDALGISEDIVSDDLTYNTIAEWDSRGHMALVVEIETNFDIMMDTDDIIAMSSFGRAKSILAKYGVCVEEAAENVA
jgi:acyl carrier protein